MKLVRKAANDDYAILLAEIVGEKSKVTMLLYFGGSEINIGKNKS